MKSLLRTILDECEKNKLMYRANAYDLAGTMDAKI